MGFLQGKRALITGIASSVRLPAASPSDAPRGAEVALTYQNDKLQSRVEKAAAEFGSAIVLPLDVADDAQIAACSSTGQALDGLDILVHCIAYAPREAIEGEFLDGLPARTSPSPRHLGLFAGRAGQGGGGRMAGETARTSP